MTFSFDDAVVEDLELLSLLDKYELKATFNINSGCFGQKDRMPFPGRELYHEVISKEMAASIYTNQEVAAHGHNHLSMTDCPPDSALSDVILDRIELEKLLGRQIRGFAYPYGHYNEISPKLLNNAGIYYARTVQDTFSFELPENFFIWNPTCHFLSEKRDGLLDDFLSLKVTPYSPEPKLFYLWGHGYELTVDEARESWEFFLKKASKCPEIWYATNLEIVSYLQTVKRLEYSADRSRVYNPSAKTVWLYLNDQVVEVKGGEEWSA